MSFVKTDLMRWLIISTGIMLFLPWLAVTFVKSDAGMAVCLILFFIVNPLYFCVSGAAAGRDMRHLWSLPVITAILFVLGTWICFGMGEMSFMIYAGVYIVLGTISMLISKFTGKKQA